VLPNEIKEIFYSLFFQIGNEGCQFSKDEFIETSSIIFKQISLPQRNTILKFHKNIEKHKNISQKAEELFPKIIQN